MRLIDADAFCTFLREVSTRQHYETLLTNKDKFPTVTDVIEAICCDLDGTALNGFDNAPTVEYTFEEAFQKTVCEKKLYCPNKRQKGEWIDTGDKAEYWAEEYQCSVCGAKDHWHNFCPNCGADMRRGEKNE